MALNPYDTPRGRLRARAEATRRQFLLLMGGLASLGAVIFGGFESVKFLFPAATTEAPLKFKTDFTFTDLTGGVAGGKAKAGAQVRSITADRVTVVLDDAGIYAVFLVCTHLGCTPNYVTDVVSGSGVDPAVAEARGMRAGAEKIPNGWACPCHGSRYFIDSTNFYGPAPRPMDWVDIAVAPDGYFVIDRGNIVAYRQAGDTTAPAWRLLVDTQKNNGKTLGV
ncbi:MAG: Rieske 2Fe-2S domain-containing protein [Candidatus Dormibacteraeota bacterium]|nr:Rieske 2Fe-2S domain-containing protein [Candidatus Dormibacteraeota bacterium]MBV9526257.1 Rieske 2Fe-2S domain-containing protein [Candidatus Dormibacteraeota bacterium]